jgi:Xaa-Pro aminopeptidase
LHPEDENLVDAVWGVAKPSQPTAGVFIHETTWTGRDLQQKLFQTFEKVTELKAESTLISNLAQIAWVLNLRGADITFNPVFFSYLYLEKTEDTISGTLYTDEAKLTPEVIAHLGSIKVKPYAAVFEDV